VYTNESVVARNRLHPVLNLLRCPDFGESPIAAATWLVTAGRDFPIARTIVPNTSAFRRISAPPMMIQLDNRARSEARNSGSRSKPAHQIDDEADQQNQAKTSSTDGGPADVKTAAAEQEKEDNHEEQ
jgi:hypothetical protein